MPVTGIPSPGTDGPTFLDLVWDHAPFATHQQFVTTVTDTATAFVTAGVFTAAEKNALVTAADAAKDELATLKVQATAKTQKIATTTYVAVSARNTGSIPLSIELTTAYGSRTVPDVEPGQTAYQSFNTRAASIPPGTATVKATGAVDGQPVTATIDAAYS
ncbi:hypothetical protein M1L60_43695 [Actinoplanes sp. TRM 88003]|uniref:Uncharacterized protein n=1 Tax=Paractinoplanes aksuensis TaxID=2939490 RepID=A0ABT1E303_9ACTN|nr:hypothetical protein [Actinoplanes aksuensis]MCO8277504.1 hypothetical protein [Actinoplanes aksuensis]